MCRVTGYVWICGCGLHGRGEAAAQRHAAECPLMGRPHTNPDHAEPRPGAVA